ncbi:hypothetical protein GDO81_005680 [Engystomops pustulosus]|uniref:Uncharacterized protein n=1 Tax=Engystomops pustulosus TaxID=76066 RepID=A0AAV7CQU9_ENGPU|nr:hypothetical protein GDO81_005680 [Engystomops pustulosus]
MFYFTSIESSFDRMLSGHSNSFQMQNHTPVINPRPFNYFIDYRLTKETPSVLIAALRVHCPITFGPLKKRRLCITEL